MDSLKFIDTTAPRDKIEFQLRGQYVRIVMEEGGIYNEVLLTEEQSIELFNWLKKHIIKP